MSERGSLEIIIAKSAGTCFGVEAAIDLAETVQMPILGPLVHNPQIVGDLAQKGIPILERYADLDTLGDVDEVVITAHGYPKELKEALAQRGVKFHDATCPVLLKWVYKKIETFDEEGYRIVLVGDPQHAEIIASRSYGRNISVVYDAEAVDALPDDVDKAVAICQTTITREKFQHLVDLIRERKYPHLRAVDTRCKPVKNQQEAVAMLSQWVDAMIIIGGLDSSNTTNLARISQKHLPESTYHIDSKERLDRKWLTDVLHLGIGAGTSTPGGQIDEVAQRIVDLHGGDVVIRRDTQEDGELVAIDGTEL